MAVNGQVISCRDLGEDGVTLYLGPWKDGTGPGQTKFIVVNPPDDRIMFMRAMVETYLWGSASYIMIGDTKWAERIGYTRIKILPPQIRN